METIHASLKESRSRVDAVGGRLVVSERPHFSQIAIATGTVGASELGVPILAIDVVVAEIFSDQKGIAGAVDNVAEAMARHIVDHTRSA